MAVFTSRASGTGGRDGKVWTQSGSLEHTVVMPGAQGGVQPEELIAAAWASCYGGAFHFVAVRAGIDVGAPTFHTAITLDSNIESADFDIVRAELEVEAPGIDAALLGRLVNEAHEICPTSKLIVRGAREVILRSSA